MGSLSELDDDGLGESSLSGYDVVRSLQALLKERDRYKTALDSKNSKIHTLQTKITELRNLNNSSMEQNRSMMGNRVESLEEDVKFRQAQIVELQKEKRGLSEQLNSKSQALSDAQFKLNLMNDDLERSGASASAVEALEKQIESLSQELVTSKAAAASEHMELNAKADKRVAHLEESHANELASLKSQLASSKGAQDRLEAGLSDALKSDDAASKSQAEQKLAELKAELEAATSSKAEREGAHEQAMAKLSEEVGQLKQQVDELTKEKEDIVTQSKDYVKKLKHEVREAKAEAAQAAQSGGQIDHKDILRDIYTLLEGAFQASEQYEGTQIHTVLKKAVKRMNKQLAAQ